MAVKAQEVQPAMPACFRPLFQYSRPLYVRPLLLRPLLPLVLVILGVIPATAGCSDAASPGVDWQHCVQDERPFVDEDLSGANIRNANFTRSDLSRSNLDNADGRRAKFVSTVMQGTKFDNAILTEADFTKADLTGASFRHSNLRSARFFRAILRQADFSGANIDRADFLNADLSGAIWLDGQKVCGEGSISRCN